MGKDRKNEITVALLHLDLHAGPIERNLLNLQHSLEAAALGGAKWIITPETAVQGYFSFKTEQPPSVVVQPDAQLWPIRQLAAHYQLTVFLGCAEKDRVTGKNYNSCLVIGSNGEILGRHRKLRSHGGAEAWSSPGKSLLPVQCTEMTAGLLICADSWYLEYAQTLRERGADLLIVPAAWPPGVCGPGDCWERSSSASGLPLWVCNQTGRHSQLDFSEAESAVVVAGKTVLRYSSNKPAILLFEWDYVRKYAVSAQFTILKNAATPRTGSDCQ